MARRGGIRAGKYFGTDGFRGVAGVNLTAVHACRIGRFIGGYFRSQGGSCRVVIGKDTRRSSYMLEYALVSGLTASGADAYIMHVTTTASVSYIARTDGFDCGIMISASHNPYGDNGIKLIGSGGEKLDDNIVAMLEEYLDSPYDIPFATGQDIGRSVDCISGRNRYIGHLISLSSCSFKGYKIGLDCADGSSWQIAKSVFDALGAKTYVIGANPDGTNINKSGAVHPSYLSELVREQGLDIGFAFDGDADRCIACDEKGVIADGDALLYIFACAMCRAGELSGNTVVTTVMSNGALPVALSRYGINCESTDVGDRFVYKRMCETGASLGGEQSGHIIFSKYGAAGDGLVTAIKIMELVTAEGISLSRLRQGYTPLPQVVINVSVNDKSVCQDQSLAEKIAATRKAEGCSRVLVRPSGTEPVIRIMAEGEDLSACERCCGRIARYLEV
ncbi:MAG: phosphoglucosamine mutase [Clostridia bacterium]|nr:phosphoglucosamine mutase [Clostridia bacterium]